MWSMLGPWGFGFAWAAGAASPTIARTAAAAATVRRDTNMAKPRNLDSTDVATLLSRDAGGYRSGSHLSRTSAERRSSVILDCGRARLGTVPGGFIDDLELIGRYLARRDVVSLEPSQLGRRFDVLVL